MTYELAKKLKDAGYPLISSHTTRTYYQEAVANLYLALHDPLHTQER